MSFKFLGARKLPSFDTDEELNKYDVELGLEELKRQLRDIESDKRKETYERKLEAFNLRKAIREVEKGKDMSYEEFDRILRENSIPILKGSYFKTEIDPESGREIRVEIDFDNRPPAPSPKTGLRRRTPESRSSSPFMSISPFDIKPSSRPTTPLLPTTNEEVVRKKSICPPEGCITSGGIRRRRKTRKTRKVRKSRKNKKTNKKSKRKI